MPKFHVSRSIEINAPPQNVHAIVRDFRQWPSWSPWLVCEPDCTLEFAEDGKSYRWDGEVIGSGEIRVTEDDAPRHIDYRIAFHKPWKSVATAGFSFVETNGGAEARWTMDGSLPFFLFWMKSMMTSVIGMDYERGLAMLKDYAETGSVPSKLEFPGRQAVPGCRYLAVRNRCLIAGIGAAMEGDFARLHDWFCKNDTKPAGNPFSIYHKWDHNRDSTEYSLGFPVSDPPADPPSGFITGERPACNAYAVTHTGAYRHLGNAWAAGYAHARARRFALNRKIPPFEIYASDPREVPEPETVTAVYLPAR